MRKIISIHAPREGGDFPAQRDADGRRISIHAPREGGDLLYGEISALCDRFQSTPPARGATAADVPLIHGIAISIHAPREGGDSSLSIVTSHYMYFNPRPPRGGRLVLAAARPNPTEFQSTPPARGATKEFTFYWIYSVISIHAPREGGDCSLPSGPTVARNFNPRPPRGGRRAVGAVPQSKEISIHAPREGGDAAGRSYIPHQAISIHAPREGGDAGPVLVLCVQRNFNPRPPRGGRPQGRYARQHL